MNNRRTQLIQQLSTELLPVNPAGNLSHPTGFWLLSAATFCSVAMLLIAPFRSGWLLQLQQSPMFLLEVLLGVAAIGSIASLAFISGIPGHPLREKMQWFAGALAAAWIVVQAVGIVHPALPLSPAGGRPHCNFEVILYSLPPLLLGILLLGKLLPLDSWRSGALLGLAAGLLPAWLMQLACAYEPVHGLLHHLAPVLVTAVAGALLLDWQQRRRRN